jgi:cleavage and polyadenylation specificity factor subunit 4
MDDVTFDFEEQLQAARPAAPAGAGGGPAGDAGPRPRNFRQTVCTYWLRNLCMKGDTCGFLHEFNPERMPVCRTLLKFGACKEPDCPYKHSTQEIKECNMYKLGFCVYGPACRFKHSRQPGPPPDPERLEAAKPRELRDINRVANEANDNILAGETRARRPLRLGGAPGGAPALPPPPGAPSFVDQAVLAAVGQRDLRYGF